MRKSSHLKSNFIPSDPLRCDVLPISIPREKPTKEVACFCYLSKHDIINVSLPSRSVLILIVSTVCGRAGAAVCHRYERSELYQTVSSRLNYSF